jgi:hypothetical protein
MSLTPLEHLKDTTNTIFHSSSQKKLSPRGFSSNTQVNISELMKLLGDQDREEIKNYNEVRGGVMLIILGVLLGPKQKIE